METHSFFSTAIMCPNTKEMMKHGTKSITFSISLQRKWAGLSIGQEVEGKPHIDSVRQVIFSIFLSPNISHVKVKTNNDLFLLTSVDHISNSDILFLSATELHQTEWATLLHWVAC